MTERKNEDKGWSLSLIEIPKPCEVPWASMKGNDRVRFCGQCSKNVYNISALSEKQAMKLLIDNEGKVCISMLKRADGTIVSDNCPPILRPVRNSFRRLAAVYAAFTAFACNQIDAFAGDFNKNAEKRASQAQKSAVKEGQSPEKGGCAVDTLIVKPSGGKAVSEPVPLGGAIAPPQAHPGTGPIGSHIDLVGYGVEAIAKSGLAEEIGKQILKQWHPPIALKKKEVMVSFWLDAVTGKVKNASIASSSGSAEADRAALSAVQSAGPFKPSADRTSIVSSYNVRFPLE